MQRVPRDHRHHHVQFELSRVAGHHHRGIAPIDLIADLVDHLRYGRIHLPRHDRRTGLHGRQRNLGDAGARPHRQQPQIARDLAELDSGTPQRAGVCDHVTHALRDAKAIGGRHERQLRQSRQRRHRELRVVVPRIQARPDRGRAEIELVERLAADVRRRRRGAQARRISAEFLAQRDGHGVLQMRAADLEHVRKARRLRLERLGERAARVPKRTDAQAPAPAASTSGTRRWSTGPC